MRTLLNLSNRKLPWTNRHSFGDAPLPLAPFMTTLLGAHPALVLNTSAAVERAVSEALVQSVPRAVWEDCPEGWTSV